MAAGRRALVHVMQKGQGALFRLLAIYFPGQRININTRLAYRPADSTASFKLQTPRLFVAYA